MSNAVKLLCNESIREALQQGHKRVILGASVDAMRQALDGKVAGTPFPQWEVEVKINGVEQTLIVPMFCDPGLPGLAVYAIPWPDPNPGSPVNIFKAEGAK